MSQEDKDENLASESSTEAQDGTTADSSTAEGAETTGSPVSTPDESAKTDEKSARERLIAQLTGAEEVEEDDAVEPEAPVTETKAEPAESETEKVEAKDAPAGKPAAEPAKPEGATDDDISAPIDPRTKPATKKRIESLISRAKAKDEEVGKMKPMADYGQAMLGLATQAKMSADDLGAWLALAIEINEKPQQAPARLLAQAREIAKRVGIQLPVEVQQTAPAGLEDMIIDGIAEMSIPGDVGKKLLEKIRSVKTAPATADAVDKPSTPAATPSAPATPTPVQTPRADAPDQTFVLARQAAEQEIAKTCETYAKQYPADWAKIRDAAIAGMDQYIGTHPTRWSKFFKQEVESAKAKFSKSATKGSATPTTTLRPTSTTAPAKPKTGRTEAVDILTGKA